MFTNIIEQLKYSAERYEELPAFYDLTVGAESHGIHSPSEELPGTNSTGAHFKFQSISFRELYELVKSISTGILKSLPFRETPEPICVMTERNMFTPACYLAVALTGSFYAPIDSDLPEKRILQIISVANPRYLITDKKNQSKISEILSADGINDIKILVLEDLMDEAIDEELINSRALPITSQSPLYMIFTSGSTGKPKGVLTAHISVLSYLDGLNKVIRLDETDVLGSQAPFDYIAAVRDMYLPLVTGCATVIIPRNLTAMPQELFKILNEFRVTALCWSAAGLEVISKLGGFEEDAALFPRYIKRIVFSGSVISNKALRAWQDALPNTTFINQYGPTETTASCTYYVLKDKVEGDTVIPIGRPFDHYGIVLLGDSDEPIPECEHSEHGKDTKEGSHDEYGEAGEICVYGDAVAIEYYNNPKQTEESFNIISLPDLGPIRIYRTGDLGRYDEDGNLIYLGRKDRQIKYMGHRVELAEIENAALQITGVDESVSMYQKEKSLIYLFYVGDASSKDIAVGLRSSLPSYMVPRRIVKLESIPTLPNEKHDLPALKAFMD